MFRATSALVTVAAAETLDLSSKSHAEMARWTMNHSSWGAVATTSVRLNGVAFANPISMADAFGDGTPYFYVSTLDETQIDLMSNPACTLTLSEASIDCQTQELDPEDPRCARLSVTGTMKNVSGTEADQAKAALFALHPPMKSWPSSHGWIVQKLDISNIWLLDGFGGAADLPVADYTKASIPDDVPVINASHTPSHSKPHFWHKTNIARWALHESRWASLGTTSIHLDGVAWGNVISVSDGHGDNSSGIPYMYVSDMDTSMEDIKKNPKVTLTFSEAAVDCEKLGYDPEDPRCVRLALTGSIVDVTDADELAYAKDNLFADHPVMKEWPSGHDFHVVKLDIESIWLLYMFGGAADIAVEDFMKAEPQLLNVV